jgi:hypothetical protein
VDPETATMLYNYSNEITVHPFGPGGETKPIELCTIVSSVDNSSVFNKIDNQQSLSIEQ